MPEEVAEGRPIPIVRTNPSGLKPEFVNDFSVSNTESTFFLTFSVIEPPLAITQEDVEAVDSVEAVALAKFAVTPFMAKRILEVLSERIQKFEKRSGAAEK